MNTITRRQFVVQGLRHTAAAGALLHAPALLAQVPGDRPAACDGVTVLNPAGRVPVGIIIDDSTCLVNLNRFAMPHFAEAFQGQNKEYDRPWQEWPVEIPDTFVRKFGEWAAANGVKGKYSIVPFPACVGRMDRELPGWTRQQLRDSLDLVRTLMMPNWDIHPEMVTHTRVINTKTGQPYPEHTLKFMENWEWTAGKSVDQIANYVAYGLRILREAGLNCEGVTSPGGFGNGALPEYAQSVDQAVRHVFGAEIPHYFRDLHDHGEESVAPKVQYARNLDGPDPRCVVSVLACTGDWTGGWHCVPPEGADRFITPGLDQGRLVEVIQRGEPAYFLAHWTGVHWKGEELGFKIFQEVVKRLKARFDNLIWMKTSELARYWAARELTRIERNGGGLDFKAPFACPGFTVKVAAPVAKPPRLHVGGGSAELREVGRPLQLASGTWCRDGQATLVCFDLRKGPSRLELVAG